MYGSEDKRRPDYALLEDALPQAQVRADVGCLWVVEWAEWRVELPPASLTCPFSLPQFVLVPDAGHACYLDAPERFNRELLRFLDSEVARA